LDHAIESPIALFFKGLRSNRVAFYSCVVILIMTLLSLSAYLVIADDSPNANNQIPEIALRKPMSDIKLLKVKTSNESKTGFVSGMIFGFPRNYRQLAFDSLHCAANDVSLFYAGKQKFITYDQILSEEKLSLSVEEKAKYITDKLTTVQTFLLGTDKYGRSVLSRLILGIRVSLLVGLLAVIVSLFVGVTLGAAGGYYGGWIDQVLLYFINVVWAIPTLLLVFAIVLALGRGMGIIFFAIGLTMWVDVARIVRGQVMEVKNQLYVQAAKSLGQKSHLILFKHILPNIMGPILVVTAANFATAILVEAGLSYLGFGINPPTPSLGNMLNENYGYALSGYYTLALAPALVVSILVLCFNLLGTGLRDVFDVRKE